MKQNCSLSAMLLFCGLLQLPLNALYKSVTERGVSQCWRSLIEISLYVVANPACVCLWRGVWLYCDIYLLPQNKTYSSLLTHFGAFVILSMFLNSCSVVVKGCMVDGENDSNEGIVFPNQFIRYITRNKKSAFSLDNRESTIKTRKEVFTISSAWKGLQWTGAFPKAVAPFLWSDIESLQFEVLEPEKKSLNECILGVKWIIGGQIVR